MILMICWPGWTLWMTSWPRDLVLTRSMKSRATLKFTSASSRAIRTSRNDSATFDSEIFPSPRRLRKAFWSFVLKESNMVLKVEFKVQSSKFKVHTSRFTHHASRLTLPASRFASPSSLPYTRARVRPERSPLELPPGARPLDFDCGAVRGGKREALPAGGRHLAASLCEVGLRLHFQSEL